MRAAIQFPLWMQAFFGNATRMNLYAAWVRDLFISKLDAGATGNDYKVSTCFKWAGTASAKGYAFIVEERDGAGAATGNQWMFVLPYDTSVMIYTSYLFQSHETYLKKWGANDTNNGFTTFCIFFFPEGGLRRSQITLNGGHTFTAPDVGMEIRNAGDTKRGIIESVSGNVLTVRHTVGSKWAAADVLTDVATSTESGTIATEDWRTFPDVGWTDFSALTLAADFTAPASNPYSAIASFLPKEGTGAPHRNYQGRAANGQYADVYALTQIVFDNTKKFCAAYCSIGNMYSTQKDAFISGDVMVNADLSSTYKKGGLGWRFSSNPQNGLFTEQYYHEAEYYGGGAGVAGVHASFSERSHENFSVWNAVLPTSPQTYAESRVYLYDTNEAKGWIDPDIVRIQGAANHYQGLLTSRGGAGQNLCIKQHDQLMFPWVSDLMFGHPKYELDTEWPPLHLWV